MQTALWIVLLLVYQAWASPMLCFDQESPDSDQEHKSLPRPLARRPMDDISIVNGIAVGNVYTYPWMVSLARYSQHICGGFMITPNLLLTAAHCSSEGLIRGKRAAAWRYDRNKSPREEGSVEFDVIEIINHPGFNEEDVAWSEASDPPKFNDTAIWVVKPKTNPLNRPILTVKIATPEQDAQLRVGTMMRAIGWGQTSENGKVSKVLNQVDVPYISNRQCQQLYEDLYPHSIVSHILCAAYVPAGGKDACAGDSGGPIFTHDPTTGEIIVYAITSWGEGCARGDRPGVYTRVAPFLDWIQAIVDKYSPNYKITR